MSTRTVTFSPFTRVEGDLHMSVTIDEGTVTEARASGTLFRGFEILLRGREPVDAMVMTCRICGQCGASHSAAAAEALAQLTGLTAPPNGVVCRSIIQAVEAILNNLTHFYLSFAADLAHPRYGEAMARRFAPVRGESFRAAIRARKVFLAMLGLFAGKWPNTLAIQPGGTTKTIDRWEVHRARGILAEFREFLERSLVGCPLEVVLALQSAADLDAWMGENAHAESDLGAFVRAALSAGLDRLGRGPQRFLAIGGYPAPDGGVLFPPGYYESGRVEPVDAQAITESVRFAWLEAQPGERHPSEGLTEPAPEKAEAYTWCKAPRYRGRSVEVGPLARALVGGVLRTAYAAEPRESGHPPGESGAAPSGEPLPGVPLVSDLVSRHGVGVYTRMVARLWELLVLTRAVGGWLGQIDPEAPFCVPTPPIPDGLAAGLVAAPRGFLGHWLRVENGRIRNYQVVTPTGWNLSPRDADGQPGPVEEALVGTAVDETDDAVDVAHVVRSFDPCLFCTVH